MLGLCCTPSSIVREGEYPQFSILLGLSACPLVRGIGQEPASYERQLNTKGPQSVDVNVI